MRRTVALLTSMALTLLLAAGTAFAMVVNCSADPAEACLGTSESDKIFGTPARDIIDAKEGRDQVNGRGGDDEIWGRSGLDDLQGGDGNDVLYDTAPGKTGGSGSLSTEFLDGDFGDDTLISGGHSATSTGSFGDDTLEGGGSKDFLEGGIGNDVTRGGDGNDFIEESEGSDDISGGSGNDDIRDHAEGRLGTTNIDTITGGPGMDRIRADVFTSDLFPGDEDHIDAVDGEEDTVRCGGGTDTVEADAIDVVAENCETVNIATP